MENKGYSLLELLMVLAVSTVLMSGLFLSLNYLQLLSNDLTLKSNRDGNFWIVPLLLSGWVSAAGNNRWNKTWVGARLNGGIGEFKSDIDGVSGFPDDDLSNSYEDIALDHREDSLSLRSGSGSFQPVLRGIDSFETRITQHAQVIFSWSGKTQHSLRTSNKEEIESEEMKIHLWNYRANMFSEKDP